MGKKEDTFNDYKGFVEKFKPKKTTDDCYTPSEVYECVLEYVQNEVMNLDGYKIERPFFPGSDYQKAAENYDGHTVVIDNPPFSILAEIKRFYLAKGIKFFLFAPHLTLFSTDITDTISYIITNADITYENGAKINTDFVTNMLEDVFITTASNLRSSIRERQAEKRQEKLAETKKKYKYPANVITACSFDSCLIVGIDVAFKRSECYRIRRLDSQVPAKKAIFGYGYIISEEARKRAEEARKRAEEARAIVWSLSEREKEIIKSLS